MSRRERRTARADRLRALLDAGDHRAARAEARLVLANPAAAEEERAAASAVLASLAPEPGAVAAGALGVAAGLALVVLVLLRG